MLTYSESLEASTTFNDETINLQFSWFSSIDNQQASCDQRYSLVPLGAILNIIQALIFAWIVIVMIISQTPREELIAIKVGVNLNAFFHCCSIHHQLLLFAYQCMFFNFPQWESTIVGKKMVPIASLIGTVIIASFIVPAFYCNFLPQALKFYMSLTTTVSLALCVGMLFQQKESVFFPLLVLCMFSFASFTPALIFFHKRLVLSQPIYLAVAAIMCRTTQIIVSPLIPIFLVSGLREAAFENAVELSLRLTPGWFDRDEHNVRLNTEELSTLQLSTTTQSWDFSKDGKSESTLKGYSP